MQVIYYPPCPKITAYFGHERVRSLLVPVHGVISAVALRSRTRSGMLASWIKAVRRYEIFLPLGVDTFGRLDHPERRTFAPLEMSDHAKKVIGTGVSFVRQHPH